MKPNGRPPVFKELVQRAIASAPGSTISDLFELVQGNRQSLSTVLMRLRTDGAVCAAGPRRDGLRHFATIELADAWTAAHPSDVKHVKRVKHVWPARKVRPSNKPVKVKVNWLPEHAAALLQHYPTRGAAFVSEVTGRSVKEVYRYAAKHDIKSLVFMREGVAFTRKKTSSESSHSLVNIKVNSAPTRGPAYLDGPLVFTAQTVRTVYTPMPRALRTNTFSEQE